MSVSVNVNGIPQPPVRAVLGTSPGNVTNAITGTGKALVTGIRIANQDNANAVRCTLYWLDSGGTDRLFYNKSIAAGDSDYISDEILLSGDGPCRQLRGSAGSADDIVITVYQTILSDGRR